MASHFPGYPLVLHPHARTQHQHQPPQLEDAGPVLRPILPSSGSRPPLRPVAPGPLSPSEQAALARSHARAAQETRLASRPRPSNLSMDAAAEQPPSPEEEDKENGGCSFNILLDAATSLAERENRARQSPSCSRREQPIRLPPCRTVLHPSQPKLSLAHAPVDAPADYSLAPLVEHSLPVQGPGLQPAETSHQPAELKRRKQRLSPQPKKRVVARTKTCAIVRVIVRKRPLNPVTGQPSEKSIPSRSRRPVNMRPIVHYTF